MPTDVTNPFGARASLRLGDETATVYRLTELARQGIADLDRLPFSIRVLLENALRQVGRGFVTEAHVRALAAWTPAGASRGEVPFMPARVVLQDFTGVPCVVDLAAMRDAMGRMKGDPDRINPVVPCDLVIDDPSASPRHAVLSMGPPVRLADLGSGLPTSVGEQPVLPGQPQPLRAGPIHPELRGAGNPAVEGRPGPEATR